MSKTTAANRVGRRAKKVWENLSAGERVLILLDELPPYFESAKSKAIGSSGGRVTAPAPASRNRSPGPSSICAYLRNLRTHPPISWAAAHLLPITVVEMIHLIEPGSFASFPVARASLVFLFPL